MVPFPSPVYSFLEQSSNVAEPLHSRLPSLFQKSLRRRPLLVTYTSLAPLTSLGSLILVPSSLLTDTILFLPW